MEARKLLYTILAVSPAVLMAGIGVHARTFVDPFEWPSAAEDHRRTNAYIPLVIKTQDLLENSSGPQSRSEASLLATKWVQGSKIGILKPLTATTLEESPSSGNKARVIEVNYLLAKSMIQSSDESVAVGDFQRAAKNLALSSDVLNCIKYSNFLSLYRVTLVQHSILTRMQVVYPKVSPLNQKELVAAMQRMRSDEKLTGRLARHTRHLINAEMASYREIHALEGSQDDSEPTNAFFEQPALAKGNGLLEETELENIEFALPSFSLEVRQCLTADQRNRLMIQKIMSLSPHSVS